MTTNNIIKQTNKTIICIYAGRFQPFHINHYKTYKQIVKKYGKNNVYIATSNKHGDSDSPFSFEEKKKIITTLFSDIKKDHIVQVKSPYAPKEILQKYDKNNTVYVAALGKKDSKRLINNGKYFSLLAQATIPLQTYKMKGYIDIIPLQTLKINGKIISGTVIRKIFANSNNEESKKKLFKILYNDNFNQKIYNLFNNNIVKEVFDEFIINCNIVSLIKEISNASINGVDVDDGPATWYTKWSHYQKQSKQRINALLSGWKIINYIVNDGQIEDDLFINYTPDTPLQVTYFPAGVVDKNTPTNYKSLKGRQATKAWLKDIKYTATALGFKFLDWQDVLQDIEPAEKDSKINWKNRYKDKKLTREEQWFTKQWWKKQLTDEQLITEGGAAGHMLHPFENNNLTFKDFEQLIVKSLNGTLQQESIIEEKLDGQNLMISWKNNQLIAARNKGHIKNFGKNALNIKQIQKKFAQHNKNVRDAFVFAMNDLQNAISKLSDKQRNLVFSEGQRFANLEIIYPQTENVIPYNKAFITFHSITEYNKDGAVIDNNVEGARTLQKMINKINANVQKTFKIEDKFQPKLIKVRHFDEKKDKFIKQLNKLKNKFNLKASDTLGDYHYAWWKEFIEQKAQQFDYDIPINIKKTLIQRWAFFDKSYNIRNLKKDIDNKQFVEWMDNFDKKDHKKQMKENIWPFEKLFLQLGVEVMKNIKDFVAVNPNETTQKLRQKLQREINNIKKSNDIKSITKMQKQLDKIEQLGGFDAIVPTEGLVFTYKGKTYKYSGAFAPVNQLLGILKFVR